MVFRCGFSIPASFPLGTLSVGSAVGGEEDLLALGVPLVPASRDVPAYGHVSEFVGRTPAGLGLLRCVV